MHEERKRPQAVLIDEETAEMLKQLSEKGGGSITEIIRAAARMLKYAMGRKVIIEGDKKYVDIKYFEKFNKIVDIDDKD